MPSKPHFPKFQIESACSIFAQDIPEIGSIVPTMFCNLLSSPVKNCLARVFPKTTGSTASRWLGFGNSDIWICKQQQLKTAAFHTSREIVHKHSTNPQDVIQRAEKPMLPVYHQRQQFPVCQDGI
jgi:hypothetical protein